MKKTLVFICLSLLFTSIGNAQTLLEGGSFEEWNSVVGFDHEEPAPPWATANEVATLAPTAPVTTFKETENVAVGNYATKLVTDQFQLGSIGLLVTGTIALGEFEPNLLDFVKSLRFGIPFTDKPTCFSGYYMFQPVNKDSCAVYVQLTKYNQATAKRDTLAEAWVTTGERSETYNYFNIPIEYYSDETPDTIIVIAASSAQGWEFIGEIGTTLYVDELALGYGDDGCVVATPIFPEVAVNLYPNPVTDLLQISCSNTLANGTLLIYDITGKLCHQKILPPNNQQFSTINIKGLAPGQYIYQLKDGDLVVNGGKLEIVR